MSPSVHRHAFRGPSTMLPAMLVAMLLRPEENASVAHGHDAVACEATA